MNLKNILIAGALGAATLLSSGCTHKFEEMNNNPWTSNDMDTKHLLGFSQSKIYSNGHEAWRSHLIMGGPMAGNSATYITTGSGFAINDSYSEPTWSLIFKEVIRNIEDAKYRLAKEDTDQARANIARFDIVKVVNMLRATQLYGDIPYTTAGKGFTEGIYYPEYDTQEEVLNYMVEDLSNAISAIEKVDQLDDYDAYVTGISVKDTYLKLSNSLLMKIGLMMSEADPTQGAEIFHMGYDGGNYILDWAEAPLVPHTIEGGPWGQTVSGVGIAVEGQVGGFSGIYHSEPALKYMQENKDPRLFRIASHISYAGVIAAFDDVSKYTAFDPFAQAEEAGDFKKVNFRGLRLGSTSDGVRGLYKVGDAPVQHIEFWVDRQHEFTGKGEYLGLAALNPATFNRLTPSIVLGADEVAFIIAEANTIPEYGLNDGSAFQRAIELALDKYDAIGAGGADYEAKFVKAYQENHPDYNHESNKADYVTEAITRYNAAADKRDVVITEHWIAQIGNGIESFALVSRTGGPSFIHRTLTAEEWDHEFAVLDSDPFENNDFTVTGTEKVQLHTGGATGGIRPYRFMYPNREQNANAANNQSAMQRQREAAGIGEGTHFIAVPMFYSSKTK